MEFKGTKGPWKIENRQGLYFDVTPIEDEQILASTYPNRYLGISMEVCNYNAQLIKTSPKMLEMLQDIADTLESGDTPHIYKIDELIKEATTIK